MHPQDLFTWNRIWHARFQIGGTVLLGAGLVATILLAASAASKTPPDVPQSALFVLVAGVLNVGGVWLFSRHPGGANLTASQIALRHLGLAGRAAVEARQRAEDAFDDPDDAHAREALGHLSVQLSAIEQHLGSNIDDWVQAYPDLTPVGAQNPIAEKPTAEISETEADHD